MIHDAHLQELHGHIGEAAMAHREAVAEAETGADITDKERTKLELAQLYCRARHFDLAEQIVKKLIADPTSTRIDDERLVQAQVCIDKLKFAEAKSLLVQIKPANLKPSVFDACPSITREVLMEVCCRALGPKATENVHITSAIAIAKKDIGFNLPAPDPKNLIACMEYFKKYNYRAEAESLRKYLVPTGKTRDDGSGFESANRSFCQHEMRFFKFGKSPFSANATSPGLNPAHNPDSRVSKPLPGGAEEHSPRKIAAAFESPPLFDGRPSHGDPAVPYVIADAINHAKQLYHEKKPEVSLVIIDEKLKDQSLDLISKLKLKECRFDYCHTDNRASAEKIEDLKEIIALSTSARTLDSPGTRSWIGLLVYERGKTKEGAEENESYLKSLVADGKKRQGEISTDAASALTILASRCYIKEPAKALPVMNEAVQIYEKAGKILPARFVSTILEEQAEFATAQNDDKAAEKAYARAVVVWDKVNDERPLVTLLSKYAALLTKMGKEDEASVLLKREQEIFQRHARGSMMSDFGGEGDVPPGW